MVASDHMTQNDEKSSVIVHGEKTFILMDMINIGNIIAIKTSKRNIYFLDIAEKLIKKKKIDFLHYAFIDLLIDNCVIQQDNTAAHNSKATMSILASRKFCISRPMDLI